MRNKQFNKTQIGKTGKDLLRLMGSKTGNAQKSEMVAPAGNTEICVHNYWKGLLGQDAFGVTDDFFVLGGNSLKAIQLASFISKEFLVNLQLTDIFLQPSIRDLVALITARQSEQTITPAITRVARPVQIPLSFSQERLWFIHRLEGSISYHIPAVLRLTGDLKIDSLATALKQVVNRHEVLKTIIKEQNGRAYQTITDNGNWHLPVINGAEFNEDAAGLQELVNRLIKKPFDLSKDFMLRAELIRIGSAEFALVVVLHHIASDAWSLSILIQEVMELYNAIEEKRTHELQPILLQFADYTLWQKQQSEGDLQGGNIEYWKSKLEGLAPQQLPTDFPRPLNRGNDGDAAELLISKQLADQLNALGHETGTTLFMVLLAAFKVLLHRYSNQQDICVGTSIANRTRQEVAGLIGFFVNTLALRTQISSEIDFEALLQLVKSTTLEAYEHQDTPFEKVVEAAGGERVASRSSLFQVMLVMPNTPDVNTLRLGNVAVALEPFSHKTSKFDITFFAAETNDGLHLTVEYSTALYTKATIVQMMSHFEMILYSVVNNPKQPVGLLPMLTKMETEELLTTFNSSEVLYPTDKSIISLFEIQAAKVPGNTAVVFGEERLSFQELNDRSNKLATYLQQKGVQPGTLVPLYVERSAALIVGMLGIMKAGAAYVPIDTDFPEERISYMLEDTSATIIVSSIKSSGILEVKAGVQIIEVENVTNQSTENLTQKPSPNHLAYVMYTSGSTGKPKGVMIEHNSLVDYYYGLNKHTQIELCRSFALVSTVATDLGNTVIYASLLSGGALHLFTKELVSNTEYLHQYFSKHSIDCLKIVPSHWKALCTEDELLLPVKLLVFGGEALQPELATAIENAGSSCRLVNHYGPTETTIGKLLHEIKPGNHYLRTVPIGKPFSNTKVYVLSGKMQLCPIGIPGQLFITGDGVARGYFNNEVLTNEKFIADPFQQEGDAKMYGTGDLVKWLPDGNIEFIGRVDDQVKIRGYRIELGEIETVLQQCELISQVAVLARDDRQGNKRLVAYIVPEDDFNKEAIIAYLKQKLPEYMIPAVMLELKTLPLTANGKIDRKALPAPDLMELPAEVHVAPRNESERILATIWEALLDVDSVSIHDNFFELGGDSIITIQLVSRARRAGIELQVADVFTYQTIARLTALLDQRSGIQLAVSGEQFELTGPSGLLPIQQWYLDKESAQISHFNQSVLLEIDKGITAPIIKRAFEQLTTHHDALRFKYFKVAGAWQQVYESSVSVVFIENLQMVPVEFLEEKITEIANLQQQSLNIEQGEIMRVVLMQTPGSTELNRLLIVIHHLAVDGVSWRILLQDFEILIKGLKSGGNTEPGTKSSSYRQWYEALTKYSKNKKLLSQKGYWEKVIDGYEPLKTDRTNSTPIQIKHTSYITTRLSDSLTRKLIKEVSPAYHTEINDILLAALAKTIAGLTGSNRVSIGMEGHGRQDIEAGVDTSRTVGWFTTHYPVMLQLQSGFDEADLIKTVKEQLRQVPDKGLGYGVLKYINKEQTLQNALEPDIVFNYLGQSDNILIGSSELKIAKELAGADRSPEFIVREKLAINAIVQGGELIVNWTFSQLHFNPQTIELLAQQFNSNLEILINHCIEQQKIAPVFTPSDYGLGNDISFTELDVFLNELYNGKPRKESLESLYQLSGLQQGMLFHGLYDQSGVGYISHFWADLIVPDIDKISQSWNHLMKSHTILRSAFYGDRFGIPVQAVYKQVELPLTVVDFSAMGEEEQLAAIQQFAEADLAKGYDFKSSPLMRIYLLQINENKFRMLWSAHHLLFDGWSRSLLLVEFLKTYDLLIAGKFLPAMAADRYEDYIHYISQLDQEQASAYWKNYLQPVEQNTFLPFIHGSADRNKGLGKYSSLLLTINKEQTALLEHFAQQHRLTINTLMQGVWSLLLHKYTSSNDVVYGVVVSGRPDELPDVESSIGMFINTLPLYTRFKPEQPVSEWLQGIQNEQVSSRYYQYTPLSEIQSCAGIQGDLFDTLLVFENYPVSKMLGSSNWKLAVENVRVSEQTNYPLSIVISNAAEINIEFSYNTGLLKSADIEMIRGHFEHVLLQVSVSNNIKLGDIELLTIAERSHLLATASNAKAAYPRDETLVSLFEQCVLETPDSISMVFEAVSLTYHELNQRADGIAQYLIGKGLGKESLVPVCMNRSINLVATLLGILKAGGAYVPIDPAYPRDRIGFMLDDTNAKIVFTTKDILLSLPVSQNVELVDADAVISNSVNHITDHFQIPIDPGQLAYVIYTSGSTGKPKGVMVEHKALTNLIFWHKDAYQVTAHSRATAMAGIGFDAFGWELWPYLSFGAGLYLVDDDTRLNPSRLVALLTQNKITHSFISTALIPAFINEIADKKIGLQYLLTGGDKLPVVETEQLQFKLVNNYGPTENTVVTSYYELTGIQHNVPPIGKPIANTVIYLLSDRNQLVPEGAAGEICIGGAGLARGYLNRTDLTKQQFISDPFSKIQGARLYKSGDLGRWLPDGNLEYLGRVDEQVKIRGYRIELGEIEQALQSSGLVEQSIVIAAEDEQGYKNLVGYVIAGSEFSKQSITAYLKEKLPEYMIPSRWVVMENFPFTANGKLNRKALPEPDTSGLPATGYLAPFTVIQEKLVTIWKGLLHLQRIGINDNFFELGGHSLMAMQVVASIRKEMEIELAIKDLFVHDTIAFLAIHIEHQNKGILIPAITIHQRPELIPLSFSQERLWFIDHLEGSVQYHFPVILRLKGELDKEALFHALQTIIDRHEILRTVIREIDGKGYQFVKPKGAWKLSQADGTAFSKSTAALKSFIDTLIQTPFSLSTDYPVRGTLLQLSPEENILVVTMHHIASDVWSISIIVREVVELYNSFIEGREAVLSDLPLQYADYAVWQRNYLQGEVLEKKIGYWKQKLEGLSALQLPTDFTRSTVRGSKGAAAGFKIEKQLTTQLQELSRQQGVSLFMVLLSAFKVLLQRYSGQQDISVGTSIASRQQKELEGLIGFFVNTLTLRDVVNPAATFTELLQQVKQTTLEAYEHQELPFEKVVETVVTERDMSRSPLFQVMLVLQNTPEASQLKLGDVALSGEPVTTNISKFDITFFINETAEGLQGKVEYSTDLYEAASIARMMVHFENLLRAVVINPQEKTGRLPMLKADEQQQLLEACNNSTVNYPTNKSITDLFEAQVAITPENAAIVFENETLSYRQLNERSNQLAHYLQSKGIKKDSLVPLYVERSAAMLVAMLGIMKAGAAYVPIDTNFPQDRIRYMPEDTGANIIVSSIKSSNSLTVKTGIEIIEVENITDQSIDNLTDKPIATQLAYVIYTSGSTGKPKGVMIEHRSLADYYYGLNQHTQIDQSKSFALVSTIATDLGNTVIYAALLSGGTLHVFSKESVSNIEYLHEYFSENKIDCLKIVPSHWKALINEGDFLLPKKLLVFGGEALPSELVTDIHLSGNPCRVVNHYGPTETTIGKLLHVTQPGRHYNKTIPIGKPFSNTSVYVLSAEMQLCPTGIPGQLYIAGDGVARGYYNNESLTNEKFIADPFRPSGNKKMYATGDLVKWLPDGNIEFIGRVDDQVKIRGYRIELGEIESILQQCALISQVVVLAVADKQGDKRLVAYIVPANDFDKEAINEYLRESLPDYMIPSVLMQLESLPLTANGKVDRKALPDPETIESNAAQYTAPRNETEAKLAAIWESILEVEPIGIHDDFFELGGHSLLAVRLVSAIRKAFTIEMPIGDIFDYPTVALLSTQLTNEPDTAVLPVIEKAAPRPERIPLSFSQERLWFIDQLGGSVQYHVPAVLRLKGKLNIPGLSNALQQIIERHEVLRTVIAQEETLGFQLVKEVSGWQLSIVDGAVYEEDNNALQQFIEQQIAQPFDLSKDYMLRATLVSLKAAEYVLVITLHHIASDGWSTSIIVKELMELYTAFIENRSASLVPLAIQYADYAIWQRSYLTGQILQKKLGYWEEKLKDLVPLQLPTDYPRPSMQTTNGAMAHFSIEQSLANQLQSLSQQQGTTLFMTLLAVIKVLLYRYSGQPDICVGTPIAGRQQQETEGLIGFFINTLVLRSTLNGTASFIELLQEVRKNTLEAYAHQEVPFEKVVETVVSERDMSRTPIFQVLFVLQNTPGSEMLRLGEIELSRGIGGAAVHNTSKFDLTFNVSENRQGLIVSLEYNTDLYKEKTINRIIGHFKMLVNAVVSEPEQKIGLLPMLDDAEVGQLLHQFNDNKSPYPFNKSIAQLFEEQAVNFPDNIALVFQEQQFTYQQLNERSNQLAHFLIGKGVKEETLVPVFIERSVEVLVAILGILKAGGAYVPIDPAYPADRIDFMLKDISASLVLSSKESMQKLPEDHDLAVLPAVQRLIIFISEMVLGKRLASRQKNLQPDGLG